MYQFDVEVVGAGLMVKDLSLIVKSPCNGTGFFCPAVLCFALFQVHSEITVTLLLIH